MKVNTDDLLSGVELDGVVRTVTESVLVLFLSTPGYPLMARTSNANSSVNRCTSTKCHDKAEIFRIYSSSSGKA